MKKEVAEKIIAIMQDITRQLDDSVRLVMENCEHEEFVKYRRAAGKVMGYVLVDIKQPLFAEHPELTPKELRKQEG